MFQITITFPTHLGVSLISLLPLLHLRIIMAREIMTIMTTIVANAENTIIRTSCCPIVTSLFSAAVKKNKMSMT